MTDKPFSPSTDTPFVPQNYYMQALITKLICKRPHMSKDLNYSFSVQKGSQSFQTTNEITVPSNFRSEVSLEKCKLNFMVNSYNPERPNQYRFTIRQCINENSIKEVGQYLLNCNTYIDQYNISQNGAYDIAFDFSEDFAVEAELYVDRNQHGLFRLIRDIKNPKPKEQSGISAPRITRQRISEVRKQMDEDAQKQTRGGSKQKKFTRFSPRREPSQEKKQAELFAQRRKEEERKKAEEEQLNLRKLEQQQARQQVNKKKQPVARKKEWIIPAAQEIANQIAKQSKVKRKPSKESHEQKTKADDSKITSKSKDKSGVKEPSFLQKLPLSPRILVPLLVILVASIGYFIFFKPASQVSDKAKNPKPKKAKVEQEGKVKGKGKGKK